MVVPTPPSQRIGLYSHLAAGYDRRHDRWLRHAGGEGQAALEGAVRALVHPGARLLDVGCGTGRFARNLVSEGYPMRGITLLDPSDAMLEKCADMDVETVKGRLESLPFLDRRFDIVTCAWALETAIDLDKAIAELCRVVRRRGTLCLVFCANRPPGSLAAWFMRLAVSWTGAGAFLNARAVVAKIQAAGPFQVSAVPTRGPAFALIARRL